jgi:PAS domain S-box-containing protein
MYLQRCEDEPIRVPGHVQEATYLLSLTFENLQILRYSENFSVLGYNQAYFQHNRSLGKFFTKEGAAQVERALANLLEEDVVHLQLNLLRADGTTTAPHDLIFRTSGQELTCEIEAIDATKPQLNMRDINRVVERLNNRNSFQDLCDELCQQIKHLLGYDRVKLYKFDEDWNGQVIAEARESFMPSYNGLHFPASDIPQQARELYEENLIRLISNVNYTPSAVIDLEQNLEPLDMSALDARSVSPVHIEYLQNMEVEASYSISILYHNQLWGLLACHNATPRHVPYNIRNFTIFLGKTLSTYLLLRENTFTTQHLLDERKLLADVSKQLSSLYGNIADNFKKYAGTLMELFQSFGVALYIEGRLSTKGIVPSEKEIKILCEWLASNSTKGVYDTHRLSELNILPRWVGPDKQKISGLMAIAISRYSGEYLLLFRPEYSETLKWGGNPEKNIVVTGGTAKLSPRKSFELYINKVHNRSRKWTASTIDIAHKLRDHIVDQLLLISKFSEAEKKELKHKKETLEQRLFEKNQELQQIIHELQYEILERKRAEEQLHLSLTSSNLGTWSWTIANDALELDTASGQILGIFPSGENDLKDFLNKIIPDHRSRVERALRASFNKGLTFDQEFTIASRGELPRSIIARGSVFYNLKNKPERLLGILLDITEKKQIHERLRTSEYKYKLIADATSDIIILKDVEGKIEYISPSFYHTFGYEPPAYTDDQIFSVVHPNDVPHLREQFAAMAAEGPGRARVISYRKRHEKGHYLWVEANAKLIFDENKEDFRIISSVRDITDRKENERKLLITNQRLTQKEAQLHATVEDLKVFNNIVEERENKLSAIINGAGESILILNPDYTIQMVNEAASQLFQCPADVLEKMQFLSLVVNQYIEEVVKILISQHQADRHLGIRPIGKQELFLKRNEATFPADVSISRVDTRKSHNFVVIISDLTERKEAERQVKQLNEGLEEIVKERTERLQKINSELEAFNYSVSHDLRSPLRAIEGYAELLRLEVGETLPPDSLKMLSKISDNATKMGKLIEGLLKIAKIGRQKPNFQLLDVNKLVREIIDDLLIDQQSRQFDLRIDTLPTIEGDVVLINQVFLNLLSNAVKFTSKKKSTRIEVSSETENKEVTFSVKDNGAGFKPEFAHKLFGLFNRLHSESEFEGTGLGLAIVQRAIHFHGGTINAFSEEGKGTEFRFTLPLQQKQREDYKNQ